jgi:hypothetical protein
MKAILNNINAAFNGGKDKAERYRLNAILNEIYNLYRELPETYRTEVKDTLQRWCDECENRGEYEVMECRNNTNECCGGCFVTKTCEECQ